MRIAYLDCFSGISGDMFLGALVDAGVPFDLLQETVRALNIGATLEQSRVTRNGIGATKVDVLVDGVKDMPREEFHAQKHTHADGATHSHPEGLSEHNHPHTHDHEHSHHRHGHDDHCHSHTHQQGGHPHRGLREIRDIINAAPISENARRIALNAFELLCRAEAKIHNRDLETVHFHEVGSVDAIVDIVCAAVGGDWLNIDEWCSSALNTGSGHVHCAHGTLPVPAPATLEILKGAPIYSSGIKKELVTPTGAAILRTIVSDFTALPRMRVESTGYGAGARDFADTANVLRMTIGEAVEAESSTPGRDKVAVLEANVDDSTPQVIGYTLERLFEAGALDAFTTPVQMKKSRPGVVITVLAKPQDEQRMA
ncbi:MAG TPA: nickel pincer cofactor biosynthesis protein LarC, partial [Terriglobales bacterium]